MQKNWELEQCFKIYPVEDEIFKRMYLKSFKANTSIKREELRYIKVLHYDFDDEIRVGEMVSHYSVADDLLTIFRTLFDQKYQIEKLHLIDDYDADDEKSMADNNSSVFNYRTIKDTDILSKHSAGIAIDINPKYNPYITYHDCEIKCQPLCGLEYCDREKQFAHKIDENDLCYQLFKHYGFEWGGHWTHAKDYQHFEKK